MLLNVVKETLLLDQYVLLVLIIVLDVLLLINVIIVKMVSSYMQVHAIKFVHQELFLTIILSNAPHVIVLVEHVQIIPALVLVVIPEKDTYRLLELSKNV